MYGTLKKLVARGDGMPERSWQLDVLSRVLDGTLYDVLDSEFHEESTESGEYVPIRKRRPSVRYGLCRIVVEDTIALLFGDGRFPTIECEDEASSEAIAQLIAETGLAAVMVDAAHIGSVGSVAVLMRVLKQRVFFSALPTKFLTPRWDPEAPDTLVSVTEQYQVYGDVLAEAGYDIAPERLRTRHWFCRVWDGKSETWFMPWPVEDKEATPQVDAKRTVTHQLGFVPLVWIRNLPGGDAIDGACTFRAAIDTSIEIDYQLSQAGRGLKYSSDPLLLIKEPAGPGGDIIKGGGNALVVSEKGDAKMLEIGGTAAAAVIEYVRTLRELALESIHGNRTNADRIGAAQSGRAMELMCQPLIWLTDRLRTSYGDNGLLLLLRMVVAARQKIELRFRDAPMPPLEANLGLVLRWPGWFHPTQRDQLEQAQTIGALRSAETISRETAVKTIAPIYEITDVPAEIARIDTDTAADDERAAAQGAQVKAAETLPT